MSGNPFAKVCTVAGTAGILTATANTTVNSPSVTVTAIAAGNVAVGSYVVIAGAVTKQKVTAVSGTLPTLSVTLDGNATATVNNAAMSFVAPTLKSLANVP